MTDVIPEGIVKDIAEYSLSLMLRQQPRFALASALATVSLFCRNNYAVEGWGTRLNLYQLVVGLTGSGKESVQSSFSRVADAAGWPGSIVSSVTSGAGLERLLASATEEHGTANIVLCLDEVWGMIASANSGANSHLRDLTVSMMSLYSKADGLYLGKAYADSKNNIEPVDRPYVGFLGATVPTRLGEALSSAQVEDGFLNRMVVHYTEEMPRLRIPTPIPLAQNIIGHLRALKSTGTPMAPQPVRVSPGAAEIYDALSLQADRNQRNPEYGPLWSRAFQNAMKLGALIAVSRDALGPIIDEEAAQWSADLIAEQLDAFTRMLEERMAESPFERSKKRLLGFIDKTASYSDSRYREDLSAGNMPRAKLLKLSKMDSKQFDSHLVTMLKAQEIEFFDGAKGQCVRRTETEPRERNLAVLVNRRENLA